MTKTIAPIHPGEVLLQEFIEPLGVTQHHLAVSIRVPPRRINEIVHGKRSITADTALRLSRYFGTSDRFWLNLQTRYDLETRKDVIGADLHQIRPLQTAWQHDAGCGMSVPRIGTRLSTSSARTAVPLTPVRRGRPVVLDRSVAPGTGPDRPGAAPRRL